MAKKFGIGLVEYGVSKEELEKVWNEIDRGAWKPISIDPGDHRSDAIAYAFARCVGKVFKREFLFGHKRKDAPESVHINGQSADFMTIDELPNEFNCKPKNKLIWRYLMNKHKENDNTVVNVEAEGDRLEIVHRYGAAAEIQEPKQATIQGSIESPAEYFEHRKDTDMIDLEKAHLEVWQDKGKLRLDCDPYSPLGTVVVGEMKMNPLLSKMDINSYGKRKLDEVDFIMLLKETRSLFADQSVCMNLIDKIQNIEYSVEQRVNKSDNERGNRKLFYEQTCEESLPDSFDLETNIFVASKDELTEHNFNVELKFHYQGGQLHFWLESPGFQEIYEDTLDEMLGTEINKFDQKIPVIYK